MRTVLLALACIVAGLAAGCQSPRSVIPPDVDIPREEVVQILSSSGLAAEAGTGFVPIEPLIAESQVKIARNGQLVTSDIRLLTKEETLGFLADSYSKVVVSKLDAQGKLTYLAGALTGEKGRYVAMMDYAKYYTEDVIEGGKRIGRVRTGVGLRLIATVVTTKAGVDLGGLLKIGLAASRNELNGSMEVRKMGVTSPEIDNLMPGVLSTISEGTIQAALEAMAAVRAKFHDSNTVVSPRYLAIELLAPTENDKIAAPSL